LRAGHRVLGTVTIETWTHDRASQSFPVVVTLANGKIKSVEREYMTPTTKRSLEGRVAFVSGASEGIGRATAQRLATEGAHVILCARRAQPLASAVDDIVARGGAAEMLVLDVGETERYGEAVANAAQRHGRLDILVNNAMSVTYAPIEEITDEGWRRDFAVNAEAIFVSTRAALKVMKAQRRGSIINISSVNGVRALPGLASYSASKAAMIHFGAVAAVEAAPYGVRVNTIAPGQIDTPAGAAWADQFPERAAKTITTIPMRRAGTPSEIASAVLFLASDESSYITGVCLCVDGGKTARLHDPE
jgi:NAD(P)-dependent dehydrogenase (short-subunit alcohol dehydrogenase family)